MKGECGSCRFWRRFREDKAEGACRRRSPHPITLLAEHVADMLGHLASAQYASAGNDPGDIDDFYPAPNENCYQTQWPTVHHADWCGEFEVGPFNAS